MMFGENATFPTDLVLGKPVEQNVESENENANRLEEKITRFIGSPVRN